MATTITDTERRDRLRLIRSENVGPVTYHQLMRHFASAAAALDALPGLASSGGGRRAMRVCAIATADAEIAALAALGARPIAHGEADYPSPLAAIEDAPALVSVIGHAHLLANYILDRAPVNP